MYVVKIHTNNSKLYEFEFKVFRQIMTWVYLQYSHKIKCLQKQKKTTYKISS